MSIENVKGVSGLGQTPKLPKFYHPPKKMPSTSFPVVDKDVLLLELQQCALLERLLNVQAAKARLAQRFQETAKNEAALKAAIKQIEDKIAARQEEQRKLSERMVPRFTGEDLWRWKLNFPPLDDPRFNNEIIPLDFFNREIPNASRALSRPLVDTKRYFKTSELPPKIFNAPNMKKENRFALLDERPSKQRHWPL